MDKAKLNAMMNAAAGLTYAEWRLVANEIEHGFQQQLNRTRLSEGEMEKISARMEIELEAYFRQ